MCYVTTAREHHISVITVPGTVLNTQDNSRYRKSRFRWIQPGTVIISDMWGAYANLANLGYTHFQINHRQGFQRMDDHNGQPISVHTNTIEGLWKHAKEKYRAMNGTLAANFESYLYEFIFRRTFRDQVFSAIVRWAQILYAP